MNKNIQNNKMHDDLRGIITSLFFLAKEAEQSNLSDVSVILSSAISKISDWSLDKNISTSDLLLHENTMINILEFLSCYAGAIEQDRDDFLSVLNVLGEAKNKKFH